MAKSSLGLLAIIFYIGQCSSLNIDLSWLSNPNFPGNSGWMQSLGFNRPNQPSYTSTPNPAPWSPSPPQNYLPQYSPWNRPTNNYWGGQPTQPNNQINGNYPGYQGQYPRPQGNPLPAPGPYYPASSAYQSYPNYQTPAYTPYHAPPPPAYPPYQAPASPANQPPAPASPANQSPAPASHAQPATASSHKPRRGSNEWLRLYRNKKIKDFPKSYPYPPSCEPTADPGYPYPEPQKNFNSFNVNTTPTITHSVQLCSDPRYKEKFYLLITKEEYRSSNGFGQFINNFTNSNSLYYTTNGAKIDYKPYVRYTYVFGDPQDGVKRVHEFPPGVDQDDEGFRNEYYRDDD